MVYSSDDSEGEEESQVTSGFLSKLPRKEKSLKFRTKRFYKLDGAVFSKHFGPGTSPTRIFNVQDAVVQSISKTCFSVTLKKNDTPNQKSDGNMICLVARSEKICEMWVKALKVATSRKLKQYYEVGQVIGEGGFATVRIGRCKRTDELRAIKTLKKDASYAELQGTEIAIIKNTNHSNIVRTYDVFETKSEIHIVMEYMEGGMLYNAIEDQIEFKEADVAQFMREILDGLHYLHGKGIVHRDLKPENILCSNKTAPLHVKISDFGLSCITAIAEHKENRMMMSTMIGTPEFIAPEIARQEQYTEKVDVWALGMLCYNVIAGVLPVDESRDVLPQIRNGINLTFPEAIWGSYSDACRSFLSSLLCMDPQKRLSPLAAMVHPWLQKSQTLRSSKIGSHGRTSHRLAIANRAFGYPTAGSGGVGFGRKGYTVHKRGNQSVKDQWKKVVVAVYATNRFRWLIHPRKKSSLDNFAASSRPRLTDEIGGSLLLDYDDASDFEDSSVNSIRRLLRLKGESEGEAGDSSSWSQREGERGSGSGKRSKRLSAMKVERQTPPGNAMQNKTSSARHTGQQASAAGPSERGTQSVDKERLPQRKMSHRLKEKAEGPNGNSIRNVSRRLHKAAESSGIMAPLRKLSRRRNPKPEEKRKGEPDEGGLELNLAELGLANIDESEFLNDCGKSASEGSDFLVDDDVSSPVTPHSGGANSGRIWGVGRGK